MPTKRISDEHSKKMDKAVEVFQGDLKGLRAGRASTGMVENLMVEYYGNPTPLKQISTLAAPQADMIAIKPFDPGSLKDIERAIKNSELSLAPIMDGKMIRLSVPPLSEDRRKQLVSQAKQLGEQAKVSIRNIRRDMIKQLEQEQKDKNITEDDLDKGKKHADEMTKNHSEKIDELTKTKSNDIMQD